MHKHAAALPHSLYGSRIGVHRDLVPGTYTGDVILSVTDPVVFGYDR